MKVASSATLLVNVSGMLRGPQGHGAAALSTVPTRPAQSWRRVRSGSAGSLQARMAPATP